jgi:hypothetical protein
MGLALYVRGDVATDLGARRSSQSRQIAPEIFQPGGSPPEAERMGVVAQLLA